MLVLISETAEEGARTAANLVAQAIRKNPALRLGLAAGRTPIELYRNLVHQHRSAGLDFSDIRLFSLDELIGLPGNSSHSYRTFFHRHLIDHIHIDPAHLHLLSGQKPKEEIPSYCASYERLIQDQGGIDLQILGIGLNGHVGFNEPGASFNSRTRLTLLSASTRTDLQKTIGQERVPEWAVTLGLGTIREAGALLLLAFGDHKAEVVAKAVEGPLSASIPASSLQLHPASVLVLDAQAAAALTNKEYYRQEASQLAVLLPACLRQDSREAKRPAGQLHEERAE